VRDATTEFRQLTDQAHLEADRERQADIVQATTSVLSRALTVDDVRRALEDHRILGPLGAVGISLSMLEHGRLRRFPNPTMAPEAFLDLEYTRLDDQLPASEAVRTQVPLFVTRYEVRDNYPRMWPYIKDTAVSSGAVLPLFAQGRPVGALVILYETKDTFTPEERNLLVALAATVGQSLQRAVLYDEEHAVAVGLQQAMLPARIPAVPGVQVAVRYRPAGNGHQIGGDWYDVVPLPDGHVGLVVGDVEGHDIHASVVMGQLRTALRAYASEGHSPGTLMARASMFLHDLDTDRFATCLYADLDPVGGRVRFVRAGHHDPLIRHPDGSSTRPGLAGGLPLGLPQLDSTPYPVTDLRLDRDDTLLFCTDGLIEYDGNDIEDGMREIEALLPDGPDDPESLAEYLVRSVEARHQQQDDIALLLVRLGPVAALPG
jgi:serine phosphatase RsbU (regulator of sigma subunit)